ncbi:MAG: Gfo/Idh/MocA family oxidoreductase [Gemmataceae bacterium]|nr:Gfo/Idh/MocA family oxidoreductase [Gemmataceae bacterium]
MAAARAGGYNSGDRRRTWRPATSLPQSGTNFHADGERPKGVPEARRRPRGGGDPGRDGGNGPGAGRAPPAPARAKPADPVRVGFVGVGVKGTEHVTNLLSLEGVELRAVCDIREVACAQAQRLAEARGQKKPTAYTRGERDFERMCQTEDLDLVYTATPWEWHVPVCVAAMRNGKHAATEVPAAVTLEECWQLVETAEATGKYCCMMENVNYMRDEMAILNVVRKGLLGELVHAEAGYRHDTRHLKASDIGDGLWLGAHHATRNGNLYPAHGLGPLAWYFDINRGDRLEYLVSMSSKARGMDLYAAEHLPAGHPKRARKYVNGDVNSSLIRTANGATIVLTHDTDLPRPYSRGNLIQGTRGVVQGFPEFKVCFEGKDHRHRWEPGAKLLAENEHPLWKQALERTGGNPAPLTGDLLEDSRLIQALRTGVPPDFDVYDAATWSVISALSEKSVADRSRPVDFPDFTRGKWKTNRPVRIMGV